MLYISNASFTPFLIGCNLALVGITLNGRYLSTTPLFKLH